jgi:hypothetical protein
LSFRVRKIRGASLYAELWVASHDKKGGAIRIQTGSDGLIEWKKAGSLIPKYEADDWLLVLDDASGEAAAIIQNIGGGNKDTDTR